VSRQLALVRNFVEIDFGCFGAGTLVLGCLVAAPGPVAIQA